MTSLTKSEQISRVADSLRGELVAQFHREWEGAKMYHCIGNHLYNLGYRGAAKFFWQQGKEEEEHAEMVNVCLLKVNINLYDEELLPQNVETERKMQKSAVENIGKDVDALKNVVHFALAYERQLSSRIEALYYNAAAEKNFYVEHFFKKLAEEQIEEEETFQNLVSKVEIYDGTKSDMYAFDEHLGSLAAKRKKSGGC